MKSIKSVCFDPLGSFRWHRFFYNLPPSESKKILQDMLDPHGSKKCKKEKLNASPLRPGAAVLKHRRLDVRFGEVK